MPPIFGSGLCTSDFIAKPKCKSKDFNFASVSAVSANSSINTCVVGDMVTVDLEIVLSSTADKRYDIGLQIALDGGNAITGTCANTGLFYASLDNTNLDLTGGFGPFYNGEVSTIGDVCGDVHKILGDVKIKIPGVVVLCNKKKKMTVAIVVSWSKTHNSSANPCLGPDNTGPETRSSCQSKTIEVYGITPMTSALHQRLHELTPGEIAGLVVVICIVVVLFMLGCVGVFSSYPRRMYIENRPVGMNLGQDQNIYKAQIVFTNDDAQIRSSIKGRQFVDNNNNVFGESRKWR